MSYQTKVYLSGGFKSGWQNEVINRLGSENFIFFNPQTHGLDNVDSYTAWDVHFVKNCDVVFAYMENSNPSGYGLAFEVGIAFALGKTVILIDEKSVSNDQFARYFRIIHRPSNIVFNNLEDGIEFLKSFGV